MADMLELMKARYQEQVQGLGRLKITHPELGDIYFKPQKAMNASEYNVFLKAAQDLTFESMVDILVLRARKEDGLKMFKPADKNTLMSVVSADDIQTLVNMMFEADGEGEVDAKKS